MSNLTANDSRSQRCALPRCGGKREVAYGNALSVTGVWGLANYRFTEWAADDVVSRGGRRDGTTDKRY